MNIRKAIISDASEIAKIHIKSWKITYKGLISEDFLENLSHKKRKIKWKERLKEGDETIFTYVAELDSKRIVGFALGGLEQYKGEIKGFKENLYEGELMAIYLLKECQRKGIGRKLFLRIIKHLLENNINSMIVWVLKENTSSEFYKSLGAEYLGERTIEIGGIKYYECAYGWNNIKAILNK